MAALLFYVIQFTWGLSANIIGGIGSLIFLLKGCEVERFYHARIAYIPVKELQGAISLGIFIFVTVKEGEPRNRYWNREHSIHEYGHTYQNMILGPLYWFVIGVPSLVWAKCLNSYREKNNVDYDSFYTEAWANRLGTFVTSRKP